MNTQTPLAYQHLVLTNQAAFVDKVRKISTNLGINPDWLMIVMYGETAFTFSPSIRSGGNPSGAVGLIQFTGDTATELGTTKDLLAKMTNFHQLDYVEAYFLKKNAKGKMKSLEDVYIVVFAPAWLGRADNIKAYISPTKEYKANSSLDKTKKGYITIGDVKARVNEWLPKKKALSDKSPKQHPLIYDSIATDSPLSQEERSLLLFQ